MLEGYYVELWLGVIRRRQRDAMAYTLSEKVAPTLIIVASSLESPFVRAKSVSRELALGSVGEVS